MPSKSLCAYKDCTNSSKKAPTLSFHRFPKDKERRQQWMVNSGNNEGFATLTDEELANKRLCSAHFLHGDFLSDTNERGKRRLKGHAVPVTVTLSENSGLQHRTDEIRTLNSQPIISLLPSASNAVQVNATIPPTPYKQRSLGLKVTLLTKKLRIARQAIRRQKQTERQLSKEDVMKGASQYLNKDQLLLLSMQLTHTKVCKWSEDEKQFALSLYYTSPKAYVFLRNKRNIKLPSVTLIRSWINQLNLTTGICPELLERLKTKTATMTKDERQCSLMWDEMAIKEILEYNIKEDFIEGFQDLGELGRTNKPAKYALLFMVRGIKESWKQPIAYFLSGGPVVGDVLSILIRKVVEATIKVGLCVRSMTCDQGSANRKAVLNLGMTEDNPSTVIEGRTIIFTYDGPHVFKSARNILLTREIRAGPDVASFEPVRELRELERSKPCRAAPKLTDRHIQPNNFEKMSVRLATQVFSSSVSAALIAGKFTGDLKHEHCLSTANFLKKMNDLFDCLNSRYANDPNPLKRALSDKNPQVEQYLKDSLVWLKKWETSTGPSPPCFSGLRLTVNGVLMLWKILRDEGTLYLLTTRLNQDALENLFSVLRGRSGYNDNPSAMKFRQNLQYSMVVTLMKPPAGTNCEEDDADILLATTVPNIQSSDVHIEEDWSDWPHVVNPVVQDICPNENDETQDVTDDVVSRISSEVKQNETDTQIPEVTLEECSMKYVAGYLIHRCLNKFSCSRCQELLTKGNQDFEAANDLLIFWKCYKTKDGEELGHLKVPSDKFHQLIVSAYKRFSVEFSSNSHKPKIGQYLRNCIRETLTETDRLLDDRWRLLRPSRIYSSSFRAHAHFLPLEVEIP